jgi:WD40 repeat protein
MSASTTESLHHKKSPPEIPHYTVLKWIGGGSYGEVWLVRDIMGMPRAIKIVRRAKFDSDRPYDREFEGLRNFEPISRSHDGLMDILAMGRDAKEGYFFYIMEAADDQVAGQEIVPESYTPKTLSSEFVSKGRLPFQRCLQIALSLSDAVRHLHERSLVHRDIKPSNIIFVNDLPKLADIGLVTSGNNAATFMGSPGYIPPEGPGAPQADVYSLGKVLYEAATGNDRLQFPKPPADLEESELRDYQELNEIILKACEANPNERYPSAQRMHQDLLLLKGGRSVRRLRRLERAWARTKAVLLLGAALTGLLVFVQNRRTVAAQAKESEERRSLLIQQIIRSRLTPHVAGWSSEAWTSAREAAAIPIQANVELLRDQAGALLGGLDASRYEYITNSGASSVAFDRQGNRLLLARLDQNASIWEAATRELHTFPALGSGLVAFANDGDPLELVYDPDRQKLLVCDVRQSIAKLEWSISPPIGSMRFGKYKRPLIAFSPDGPYAIAVLKNPADQDVLTLFAGANVRAVGSFQTPLTAVAISKDGSLATVADVSGNVKVLSLQSGEEIAALRVDRNEVRCLALKHIPRSTEIRGQAVQHPWLLAAGQVGGSVTIWDLTTRAIRTVCRSDHLEVEVLAFSPDGTILGSGGRGPVKLWDAANGQFLLNLYPGDFVRSLDFAPHGRQLAIGCGLGFSPPTVSVWDLEFGRGIKTYRGLASRLTTIAFSPDGSKLAALSDAWEVGLWDLTAHNLLRVTEAPRGLTADNAALAFSPRGDQLAFCAGRQAKVWDVHTGVELDSWVLPSGQLDMLGFFDQNHLLLFRAESRICKIRRLLPHGTTELIAEISDFSLGVLDGIAFRNGEQFIVRGVEGSEAERRESVKAFDAFSGKLVWSFVSTRRNLGTQISADVQGKYVVFSTNDTGAVVVDASGAVTEYLPWLPSAVSSEPTQYAVRGLRSGDIGCSLFDAAKDRPLITLGPDYVLPFFPRFSRDGKLLAWGNSDGGLMVCNLGEIRNRLKELKLEWFSN